MGHLVIVGVFLYFVAITAVLAWLLMPSLRDRVRHDLGRAIDAGTGAAHAAGAAGRERSDELRTQVAAFRHAVAAMSLLLRQHWRWLSLAAALLIGVPALALVWRQWNAFDGYDHTASRAADPQITALLQGEQLVPPAPLPPELFMTREVEAARPLVLGASRQWELLDVEFKQRLLVVFKLMREQHGYDMVLIEGYRSPERQAQLAALGPAVTHAPAGSSYHQYGLAADCAFMVSGRIVISERDAHAARGYELLGSIAQSVGLTWGGGWRSLRDLGHVELRRPGALTPANGNASAR